MALTTTTVSATFYHQGGDPRPGLRVQATLSEADEDDGTLVSRETHHAETDENGEVSMDLWPNTRGEDGNTYYVVSVRDPAGVEVLRGAATVPDTGTADLLDIMEICP